LPLSVNNLASRYRPIDDTSSSRRRVASPIDERVSRSLEVLSPRPTPYSQDHGHDSGYIRFPSPSTEANMEELTRRRRQREESAQQEKEQPFRDRQQEIETRTRELERDRALFLQSRDGDAYSGVDHTARTARSNNIPEPQRRHTQFDSPPTSSQGRYSYSTSNLVPPSSSSTQFPHSRSQPPSSANEGQSSTADHADFCGCDTCSASKYRVRNIPSPHDLRPPEPPINLRPEKGWIRRLSMPVGNAFSLDSKKSSPTLRNGLTSRAGEDGRMRSFEQVGNRNRSMTNLGKR
jgi:hypothetical protein